MNYRYKKTAAAKFIAAAVFLNRQKIWGIDFFPACVIIES